MESSLGLVCPATLVAFSLSLPQVCLSLIYKQWIYLVNQVSIAFIYFWMENIGGNAYINLSIRGRWFLFQNPLDFVPCEILICQQTIQVKLTLKLSVLYSFNNVFEYWGFFFWSDAFGKNLCQLVHWYALIIFTLHYKTFKKSFTWRNKLTDCPTSKQDPEELLRRPPQPLPRLRRECRRWSSIRHSFRIGAQP